MPARDWPERVAAMTLFTEDLAASEEFYRSFFEAEPVFRDANSCVFRAGTTLVNLLSIDAAPDLVAPAEPSAPGIRAVYTVPVDDVDAECERLRSAGIAILNGPVDRPWGIRTAEVQDPAGHVWEIAK